MKKIVIASGKGGTGKTFISTHLSKLLSQKYKTCYVDLDVEEPNGHLYLKPKWEEEISVKTLIPLFHKDKCQFCGKCSSSCAYNALALLSTDLLVFSEMCHGCGTCLYLCTYGALEKSYREIGNVRFSSVSKNLFAVEGILKPKEVLAPLVIRRAQEEALKKYAQMDIHIWDAPPGTSCAAMAAVEEASELILVVEASPFGEHDFYLMKEAVDKLKKTFSVIINKTLQEEEPLEKYLASCGIEVLAKIKSDKEICTALAKGDFYQLENPLWQNLVSQIEKRYLS